MVEAVRVRDSRLTGRARLESVDVVRGVIMILMALDHTRDFFGVPGISPTEPGARRRGAVLHPLDHALLRAGVLPAHRHGRVSRRCGAKSSAQLSRFLLTRGLWLILLELVVAALLRLPVQRRLPGDDAGRVCGRSAGR